MRAPARALAVAAAALALALSVAPLRCGREVPFPAGSEAPDLRFTDLLGHEVPLASYRGKVVVLNVWATWCAPCLDELPSLDRLHRALARDGLVVVGVSVDAASTDVAAFAKQRGLTLEVLRDPEGSVVARDLHVESYPTTFVVDAGGRLRERYLGPFDWDLPESLDHFRALLSESTAPTR
jgi:cytochrome c biogenesis protein CcmG, thiol:disulfide interchange protein DsbE